MKLDLSPIGRGRIVLGTIMGTLFCVLVTFAIDAPSFSGLSEARLSRALLVDALLPVGLAGPLLYFFLFKMRQLALTQQELAVLASTDSLTEIYNRGAFKLLVDAYLAKALPKDGGGAFLMVDADHFKSINDRFGHAHGDNVLRLIAGTIRDALRGSDIVARIGGEEFGVFLPGATTTHAEAVAERIRGSIATTTFDVDGEETSLSVSVGGVYFNRPTSYDELFRAADARLYGAKQAGRNLVMMGHLGIGPPGKPA